MPRHKIFPYLLRKLPVTRPNQVWAIDITYVSMAHGFVYLTAVSRKVLAWRLSITMDVAFCIKAVEEAMARFGKLDIFNSDQGSQFTSHEFTELLIGVGIQVRMDGKGRLTRQCLRRTHLGIGQIRGGLSARLRQRLRSQLLDWPML